MNRLGFAIAVVLAVVTTGITMGVTGAPAAPFGSDQPPNVGTTPGEVRNDVPRGPFSARSGPGFAADVVCRDATLLDTIPPGRGRLFECLPDGSPATHVPH
ncbi:hypothetical protein CCR97_04580 [Rhodoplanes elegans]|uniref:Uncharacterized protein n=1 Tax=Rhodoplanes elegans TaxID=29408 RepID=A0A327KKT2_9BRAD|nr:hypothetical protein [Rhodoplanes elegans]MBK5957486.1 hypothetical protein [Rhodoplanes elegans]RAI38841.1 hypothetical protein CH338_11365 [Rhodoplanes elegans]